MKPTAIRCWRSDVRSIMAHWTRCLCGTNSGYGQRQNDRMLPYGSLLFELWSQARRNGKRGRPKKTLPKGVKVRLKNKGSQRHKRGPQRPQYQAPYPEHPDTAQTIATKEMHANHLEAFHTS